MTTEQLVSYIEHPELISARNLSELQELVDEYPFCQQMQLAYLKALYCANDIRFNSQLKRVALQFCDRKILEKYINTPEQTIEEKNISNKKEQLEYSYSEYHLEEIPTQQATDKQQSVIDKFLESDHHRIRIPKENELQEMPLNQMTEQNVTDEILTESLARIYLKQKKYDKALNIFQKLNLKYPEKSSYFADQIRFLEKIIQNAN